MLGVRALHDGVLVRPVAEHAELLDEEGMCRDPAHHLLHELLVLVVVHAEHAHIRRALVVLLAQLDDGRLVPRARCGRVLAQRVIPAGDLRPEHLVRELQEGAILLASRFECDRVVAVVHVVLQDRPRRAWPLHDRKSWPKVFEDLQRGTSLRPQAEIVPEADVDRLDGLQAPESDGANRDHGGAAEDLDEVEPASWSSRPPGACPLRLVRRLFRAEELGTLLGHACEPHGLALPERKGSVAQGPKGGSDSAGVHSSSLSEPWTVSVSVMRWWSEL